MADQPTPVVPDTGTAMAARLAADRVVKQSPSGHRVARLAADPQAPSKAGRIAVQAVAGAGLNVLMGDVDRVEIDRATSRIREPRDEQEG
jgi:hypothetical protein